MEDGKDWMNELVSEAERLGLYPKDLKELAAEKAKVMKLREALGSIARNTCCDSCQEAALVAKQALKDTE